jgi:dTDP-4-amino-4,6-dideoxygalactose transaminase
VKISLAKPNISHLEKEGLIKVLESSWWTMGPITEELEEEFARYKGVKHAIAVNSCSSALFLAVKAVFGEDNNSGIDRIITTPMTFCATVNSIIHNGFKPSLVDIDRFSHNLDLDLLDKRINEDPGYIVSSIEGIIPVHFGGVPMDYMKVKKLAEKWNLKVIFDSAHLVEGQDPYIGDASCYSFNPTKNLAAPEMGMVCTNNDEIAEKISKLRLHHMSASAHDRINKPGHYDITGLGYKMNCTDIEAVIALEQLRMLDTNKLKRICTNDTYSTAMEDLKAEGYLNGWDRAGIHLYQIGINNRDDFIIKMREKGIYCGIHYLPIHQHSYYRDEIEIDTFWEDSLPHAEKIGRETVTLPMGPGMTEEEVEYVIDSFTELLKTGGYLF